MKKLLLLSAFVLLLGSNAFSQDGITFDRSSWSEILARAEAEDKLIFVDAYAAWCGPCKKMERDVFSRSEVGDFYNAKFVNAKIDMEKGEGVGLSKDFGIQAYPTLLFVNSEGEVVHRAVGYHNSDLLIQLGEAALDPDRNFGSIARRYRQGDRSPELLYNYALAKFDAMDEEYLTVAEEYLQTQDNWNTPQNMEFILQMANTMDSEMARHLVENRAAYQDAFGERAVAGKLNDLIVQTVANAKSEKDLEGIEAYLEKVYPGEADEMIGQMKMGYHAQSENWSGFAKAADEYYDKHEAESWEELNEIAWMFYEVAEGKKNLKCALGWAKESVEMNNNYYNNDTVAALYYRLGKKKKAKAWAERAIALADKLGEDHSATDLLLENIKKM